MSRTTTIALFITTIAGGLAVAGSLASARAKAAYSFTAEGELKRPTGYREWIYVGTPLTPNDLNNGKAAFPEFHNVYIEPSAWRAWTKTGKFPDGTIIIKELVGVGSKEAVSGKGYFMGDYVGLEATIKSKRRFSKEPGSWAYFTFSTADHRTLKRTAPAMPTAACNTCHQTNAGDDFVFTQYYPVLRAGKKAGRKASGGLS